MPTLEFKSKPFVYSHHPSVPFRQLDIDTKKSMPNGKKASLDDNLAAMLLYNGRHKVRRTCKSARVICCLFLSVSKLRV
jgi:hypothetical protein